jgi:hypothetical protein
MLKSYGTILPIQVETLAMKKITFLFSMVIVTTIAFSNGIKTTDPVHVLSSRMSILHLKLTHDFIGATVEIYNESDELILSQVLNERKVLIDFDNQKQGIYKIKIKKGTDEDVMEYFNLHSSPIESESSDPIIIIQG